MVTTRGRIRGLEYEGVARLLDDIRRLDVRTVIIGEDHVDVAPALILREIFAARATDAVYMEALASGKIRSLDAASAAVSRMPDGVHWWNHEKYMFIVEEALKNDVQVFGVDNKYQSGARHKAWLRFLDSHINPGLRNSFLFGMSHIDAYGSNIPRGRPEIGDISGYLLGRRLNSTAILLSNEDAKTPAIEWSRMANGTDIQVYTYGPAGIIGAHHEYLKLLRAESRAFKSLDEAQTLLKEITRNREATASVQT